MYDSKFSEYKSRQAEILVLMKEHNEADKNFYITASTLLDLAKRAYPIFQSSETFEKRQLVNFIFQNSRMHGKTWLYELKEPFNLIVQNSKLPIWQPLLDALRTADWATIRQSLENFKSSMGAQYSEKCHV